MSKINVLVTVGTALDPFDRLITLADKVLASLDMSVHGTCQFGNSGARSRLLENVQFIEAKAFLDVVSKADVVFTGAGAGTLSICIRRGHRPLVLPRKRDFGECVNDHQFELLEALVARGDVIDAARDDLDAFLADAMSTGLRRAPPSISSLPKINFEHTANYSNLRLRAARLLSAWFDPDQMRTR